MSETKKDNTSLVPWKSFLTITLESLLAFYLATFCIAMYYTHRSEEWLIPGLFLGILYAFVIIVCAKRVIEKLSMATLMLIIPIAPLLALIIVVSLIPLLELFR